MDDKAARRFMARPLSERLELVRSHGNYLGSRQHGGHQVHLYAMEGYFCELWMRLGLNYVEWIEVARNQDQLSEYVKLDPGDLFSGS